MYRRTIALGLLTALALGCVLVGPAEAKIKKVAQTGFKFLSNPVGARGAALGNAFMAMPNDASAIFWNPAGIAGVEHGSAFFDATKGIAGINYFAGAGAYNLGDYGVFGVNAMMMDYGELIGTKRDPVGGGWVNTGNFSPTAFAVGISYGRTMTDRFQFGANVKWARLDFGDIASLKEVRDDANVVIGVEEEMIAHSMNRPVFDVGVLYTTHIKGIRFGASFRNFSNEKEFVDDEFSLPLELKFGGVVDVIDLFSLHGVGANHTASFSSDFQHSRDFTSRIHYGTEYWYRGALALRFGYKSNYDEENMTYGAGLRGTLEEYTINFDYAFNDYGVFTPMHKFTIGLEF